MHVERPWAASGDYWEMIVQDPEEWAEQLAAMPPPTPEAILTAVQRYLLARYADPLTPRERVARAIRTRYDRGYDSEASP